MSWKMVPAVSEACCRQAEHWNKVPRTKLAFSPPHFGHRSPSGQRNRTKYSRQPASVENRDSNSLMVRGYSSSSIQPNTTYCVWLSHMDTPLILILISIDFAHFCDQSPVAELPFLQYCVNEYLQRLFCGRESP
jgi:hypothetical protein